jgi:uracil-DNA glycosylase
VKHGKGSQGDAMEKRFAPIAAQMDVPAGSIPRRPTAKGLVSIATSDERREGLRREILDAGAPLVITLGQEALDAVAGVADQVDGIEERLEPSSYGRFGRLHIDGKSFELLPLVHPGFQRQTSNRAWKEAIEAWPRQQLQ